jgi:TRAP-type transport system small permease protein
MSAKMQARSGILDRATLGLAALAGVFLMLVLCLVFLGVVTRYVFNAPIVGINEFVQLASVGVVMLALPYCTAKGGHVGVDVLDHAIGRWGRWIGDVLSRILSAFVLGVLVWRAGLKAADALRYGDATNMLGLPLWPFYAFLAVGMALCVVVLLVELARILTETPQ